MTFVMTLYGPRLSATMLSLMLLTWPSRTSGQALRGTAGGAITISPFQTESLFGEPGLTYGNTSTDSVAIGVTADVGWFLTPRVAVVAEVSIPFRREVVETQDYTNPYKLVSQYRDVTIFAVARVPLNRGGRMGVELVGGGGAVQQSSLERVAQGLGFQTGVYGSDQQEVLRWTWGVTGGVDIGLRVTAHLAIVPQVRVTVIDRGNVIDGSGFSLGVSKVVYRYGAGIRTGF